ncbi:MAG: YceI family protein [Sphingobacteriaceae bacterium]
MSASTKGMWIMDPTHAEVQFKVKHLVISTVTGSFKKFEGSLETEGNKFEDADIQFSLDIGSKETNQEQRDAHLRSADFFDAETYPKLTFQSVSFKNIDDENYQLAGNLTSKDVTRTVTLKVEYGGTATDGYGNVKAGFEISGKISRQEFHLTWNSTTEAGSVVVVDEVKLIINAQFVKQA